MATWPFKLFPPLLPWHGLLSLPLLCESEIREERKKVIVVVVVIIEKSEYGSSKLSRFNLEPSFCKTTWHAWKNTGQPIFKQLGGFKKRK